MDPPGNGPPGDEPREPGGSRSAERASPSQSRPAAGAGVRADRQTEATGSPGSQPAEEPESPEELRRRLDAIARHLCTGRMEAYKDDIVQKAHLKLLKRQEESERVWPFPTSYLRKTVKSVFYDELRSQRRQAAVDLEAVAETTMLQEKSPGPEQDAHGSQIGRALRRCLAKLIATRRRAVTLKLLGYQVPEIARRLGLKRKQAENLVFRGLQDLRRCLETAGVTP